MSREFAGTRGIDKLARRPRCAISARSSTARSVILLPDGERRALSPGRCRDAALGRRPNDQGVAQWVFDHGQLAGLGTDTLPARPHCICRCGRAAARSACWRMRPHEAAPLSEPADSATCSRPSPPDGAGDRARQSGRRSPAGRRCSRNRALRNSLLSSVSHELRTPLAVITGATSACLTVPRWTKPATRQRAGADGLR